MALSNQDLKNRWWPEIKDRDTARKVARQAFWAAIFVVGVTTLFATLAVFGTSFAGTTPAAYIDAAVMGVIAIGLWRMSRTAAVAALVLFIVERILGAEDGIKPGSVFLMIVLLIAFANGVRATFAYHRMRPVEPAMPSDAAIGPR
jgi:hypothetical protein